MSNLDKYQNEAVRARSKSVLVIAPPGAGKTTVILNRIKYLLEELINIFNFGFSININSSIFVKN